MIYLDINTVYPIKNAHKSWPFSFPFFENFVIACRDRTWGSGTVKPHSNAYVICTSNHISLYIDSSQSQKLKIFYHILALGCRCWVLSFLNMSIMCKAKSFIFYPDCWFPSRWVTLVEKSSPFSWDIIRTLWGLTGGICRWGTQQRLTLS